MNEVTPLEHIQNVDELMELHEFMKDSDLQEAIDLALKIVAKPEIPNMKAAVLVVRLEAYSFKFKMMGVTYMQVLKQQSGKDGNLKKNIYYSASEQCHHLSVALKQLTGSQ